jgi:copper homeostasis protein CutC
MQSEISTNKIDITFHKAFDQVSNIVEAYKQLS